MRSDQWLNTVSVDGKSLGVWDTMSGGEVDSEETTYLPGGMAPRITLGGSVTVGEVTLGRLLVQTRDWATLRSLAIARVGKAPVVVSRQPLDIDGNPFGSPLTYRGRLKTVTPPDTDSNSNDPALWQIVVTPEGSVA